LTLRMESDVMLRGPAEYIADGTYLYRKIT
jgi:hypothetical protein